MTISIIRAILMVVALLIIVVTGISYAGNKYVGGICEYKDGKWLSTEGGDGRLTTLKNLLSGRYYKLEFREGLLCAKEEGKQGKWGYINEKGDFIIQPQFDWAEGFNNGIAKVRKNGTWGFVNRKGEFKEEDTKKGSNRQTLPQEVSDLIMSNHRLASKTKVAGKTLKVYVNFQHDRAVKVIHDSDIIALAKKSGIKKVEFHDWSGFSKDVLSSDIK